jgi:hypothetical protein
VFWWRLAEYAITLSGRMLARRTTTSINMSEETIVAVVKRSANGIEGVDDNFRAATEDYSARIINGKLSSV